MREPKLDDIFVNVDERTGIATYHIANALPSTIKAMVCEDCGEPYAYINANCSYEEQQKAYEHEMEHIENEDIESPSPADQLEAHRHK
ncbi:hypothetical protein [uncultured Anaerovibrio sp.]|uniref:hypothetical protein n=1 Tax=uncultured Anaerovibrio sp. TaxID=361586 RepID=UPI002608DD85|nr:hypothetical protein [uncultured Anaerovibrio sp.]